MDKHAALKRYFGHTSFRAGQESLIDAILAGRDVFGVMPTGGGKSLCYQIPALLLPGLTLVISPLISLMKDQVMAMRESGVSAAFLNSSLQPAQQRSVYENIRRGMYQLVYVAPERLEHAGFLTLLREQAVSLVAVDEAHCISQWGQDFRPSYLKIAAFLDALPRRPVVAAFTATATAEVRQDVVRLLRLKTPLCLVTGFDRPNLYFDVLRPRVKPATLLALLNARRDRSGIVYCATRTVVEQVCETLNKQGFAATRYHAGLPDEERRRNQDDFQYDNKTVMVATNAFGMGIDKSNVGFVIHYNMPKSLEAYYQEAGRAGRDGGPADCILLYAAGDVTTAKFLITHGSGNNEALSPDEQASIRQLDYKRLDAMTGYCKTNDCLRNYILRYFGQEAELPCGSCGNCRGAYGRVDITRQAQMILSCVKRVKDCLGYGVGAALIIKVLRGSREQRLLSLGLDNLSTYGLLAAEPQQRLRGYIEQLAADGYISVDPEYATLRLTERAADVLFHGAQVTMMQRIEHEAAATMKKERVSTAPQPEDEGLFAALKATRMRLAQQEGVPAYIVFSNACLLDMAAKAPRTMPEFLEVSGVGAVKAARYGEAFLATIAGYGDGAED